jgi:hypothetical protein
MKKLRGHYRQVINAGWHLLLHSYCVATSPICLAYPEMYVTFYSNYREDGFRLRLGLGLFVESVGKEI